MTIHKASGAVLRPELAEAVKEYDVDGAMTALVGRKVFPIYESPIRSGEYPVFTRDNFTKQLDDTRKGGAFTRDDMELASQTFKCISRGLEAPLDDEDAAAYDDYMDFEAVEAAALWYKMMLNHEVRVAAACQTVGSVAASTLWSNTTGTGAANPLGDIDTNALAIQNGCGAPRNQLSLILPGSDFKNLRDNERILEKIKYTNPGVSKEDMTASLLADALGVKEVIKAEAARDTVLKGGTASFSSIWTSGYAILALLVPQGDKVPLKTPGLGRTIWWKKRAPTIPTVETYRSDEVMGEILRVRGNMAEVLQGVTTDLFARRIKVA